MWLWFTFTPELNRTRGVETYLLSHLSMCNINKFIFFFASSIFYVDSLLNGNIVFMFLAHAFAGDDGEEAKVLLVISFITQKSFRLYHVRLIIAFRSMQSGDFCLNSLLCGTTWLSMCVWMYQPLCSHSRNMWFAVCRKKNNMVHSFLIDVW